MTRLAKPMVRVEPTCLGLKDRRREQNETNSPRCHIDRATAALLGTEPA